ncbi:MAG TPA: helix-turn-helix domain-containing protein [Streptosporangiaceae bacterium]|jgi:DNA-binding PucR family transcriptional regulator|nr:helix-turn-helix domain-containing protein [Streptosporangiaceae bacterium]
MAKARAGGPRVNAETVRRIERATGALGTAAIAAMDKRLPWFRSMSAENRSWLGLVAQAAIAAFLDWIKHPERNRPAVTQVFGTAPRELARAVSLQHAVEMMRVIIDAVEAQVDELAAPGNEAELREAVLTYAREIAFSAALVYARTAEARGAWDARLEALVVDSLVHGEADDSLRSWASALNWSSSPVTVVVGTIGDEDDEERKGRAPAGVEPLIEDLRAQARRARLDLLAGVHGNRLILVVGGSDDPIAAAERFAGRFGPGPVIAGPLVRDLRTASISARAALAALRAAPAWPDAPRPAGADDLLPERALDGDPDARAALVSDVYEPLLGGGHALLDTLTTYLEQGSSLEGTARLLFVHPNTVRYRLRRVAELTDYTPSAGRDGFTLWVAVALGRLAAKRS